MKVIYGIDKIRRFRKPVVALGVFDGVHRGHINILKSAVKKARDIKGTSMVLTFSPHPQKEERLYSLEHRLRLISKAGIDVCIVINFTRKFANLSALDFVKNILCKKINAYYIYAGKNFGFGKNAEGNFEILLGLAKIYNFRVRVFEVSRVKNRPVSSTYIRTLIKRGNLSLAQKLLTRPVSILGSVVKGISLARKLGFPTANIDPHHEVIPPPGVYAVRVIFNDKKFMGACYIGPKPTIMNKELENIEVYIFDFNKNIYGKNLEIQFIKKIRGRKKFASLANLAKQIKKDVVTVRRIFPLP